MARLVQQPTSTLTGSPEARARLRHLWPWLILGHRYLGIATGGLFVIWFASGVAMIYVQGMPALSADDRLQRLAPIALDLVRLAPAEAASRAGIASGLDRPRLFMLLDRPAYRFGGAKTITLYADDGERVPPAIGDVALRIAAAFLAQPRDKFVFKERLTVADQWTLGQRRQLPVQRFAVNDPAGTEVYVSEPLAEVVMRTTRTSRLLAWLGPIPHWLYFAPLRRHDEVWRQVVLWTSGAGFVLALLGLVIGVRQWRARYAGWLKWHQIAGLAFGIFALTWVFSGWLSMEPAAWASADRALSAAIAKEFSGPSTASPEAGSCSPLGLARLGLRVKEVEWMRILGSPFCVIRTDESAQLVDATSLEVRQSPFPTEAIVAAVRSAQQAGTSSGELLTEPDDYYYQRGAVLPVLRIALDDVAGSWVYVDPRSVRLLSVVNRRDRLERWLYHGLHSLDFRFWYRRRPLWDGGMILLCTGGFVLSVLGLILGARRLRRAFFPA